MYKSQEQYHQGRDNRLAYRIARRDAHNRDAELASVVSNMSSEPNVTPQIREAAFRLLCLNHTFTSYISDVYKRQVYDKADMPTMQLIRMNESKSGKYVYMLVSMIKEKF